MPCFTIPSRKSITVVPDMHSRYFWLEQMCDNSELKNSDGLIFLGDYLDPYHSDIAKFGKYNFKGSQVSPFIDALMLKKENPSQVTMLLGNHDIGYLFGYKSASRQEEGEYFKEFSRLFVTHADQFLITKTIKIGDQLYLLSHAGITKLWVSRIWQSLGYSNEEECCKAILNGLLNELYFRSINGEEEVRSLLISIFNMCSSCRGGDSVGSVMWADLNEWTTPKMNPYLGVATQIVGHNRLSRGLSSKLTDGVECLDFYEPKIKIIGN